MMSWSHLRPAEKSAWIVALLALMPACMASSEQSAEAATNACANANATCFCTGTLTTDLRCVDCTGTPRFVQQCTPSSGDVCCATDDASECVCGSGTGCASGTGQVAVCFNGQVGGDPTPSDSDGATCVSAGICSIGNNSCRCGTTCRNYNVSAFICSFACTSDDDCTSRVDPATQRPYARCQLSHSAGGTTYDSYCVP